MMAEKKKACGCGCIPDKKPVTKQTPKTPQKGK